MSLMNPNHIDWAKLSGDPSKIPAVAGVGGPGLTKLEYAAIHIYAGMCTDYQHPCCDTRDAVIQAEELLRMCARRAAGQGHDELYYDIDKEPAAAELPATKVPS